MKWLVLVLFVALTTTGWLLKAAYKDNGRLELQAAVQDERIAGLEREKQLLSAFHTAIDNLSRVMQEGFAANQSETKRVLREIEDAAVNDEPTQDLLEQRLTDALVRVLCDGGHFHPDVRTKVCGRADADDAAAELPTGISGGRDHRPPADVGYP